MRSYLPRVTCHVSKSVGACGASKNCQIGTLITRKPLGCNTPIGIEKSSILSVKPPKKCYRYCEPDCNPRGRSSEAGPGYGNVAAGRPGTWRAKVRCVSVVRDSGWLMRDTHGVRTCCTPSANEHTPKVDTDIKTR
eukprot:4783104-Prymnesium_polylepis.1